MPQPLAMPRVKGLNPTRETLIPNSVSGVGFGPHQPPDNPATSKILQISASADSKTAPRSGRPSRSHTAPPVSRTTRRELGSLAVVD